MSNKIDQKAYLQKYLTGSSGDKKKRKKKAPKGKGFKIIDDDIDLSKLRPLDGDELDIFDEGEDAPQVAGIIDDRPEELKQLEALKTSSKWKVVNQDDGFSSKLQVEEIKKDIKETEKENELIFGKMYSDSEDEEKNDSDPSPPRKQTNKDPKPSKKHDSDSDFSPPRKENGNRNASPPRPNKSKERTRKPSRWGEKEEVTEITNKSPPRSKSDSHKRRSHSSDVSPPRKSKISDSDKSPQRKIKKNYDSDQSPPRKSRRDYASRSPIRKTTTDKRKDSRPLESHAPSKKQNNSYRTNSDNHRQEQSKKRRNSSDSDMSPPRKTRKSPETSKRKHNSDSDESPRRKLKTSDRDRIRRNNDSPPPTNKKMARTLEGKMAGLQDARQLRQENDDFRRREDEVFNKMSDEVSGRNAKAVSRKSKRETSEERRKQKEKVDRQKEIDEKYKKWSRGIKQLQDQEARVQEFMHEAAKPLARHKDDRDLESNLKEIERAGDPMLKYIRDKKRERGELGPEKPSYKGSFPPNRFNIRPGYRWDGVDRSNGYEKKFFDQQSKRKAQEEEAYKWSTEDL